jgi:hypothetical protein
VLSGRQERGHSDQLTCVSEAFVGAEFAVATANTQMIVDSAIKLRRSIFEREGAGWGASWAKLKTHHKLKFMNFDAIFSPRPVLSFDDCAPPAVPQSPHILPP